MSTLWFAIFSSEYLNLNTMPVDRVVIDADNSCLFNAVAYIFQGCLPDDPSIFRSLASEYIKSHPDDFSEVVLEMPVQDYCDKLLQPDTWGGLIELVALANQLSIEIVSVDVETKRFDRITPTSKTFSKGFVIYSGIHFDAVHDISGSEVRTLFDIGDQDIEQHVLSLVTELNRKRDFTNVSKFKLQCQVCFAGLIGQQDAVEHAQKTGHANFAEMK
ncbi:hypothetical protein RCL1_004795 [Eukaryota sp. TZLM3-RCL]